MATRFMANLDKYLHGDGKSKPEEVRRLCPACGIRTVESACPVDGTATVQTYSYNAGAVVKVGDVIADRYRVTAEIGRGGYGAVYSAEHTVTCSQVALKVMKCDFGGPDEQTIRRFFREARVTAALSHPNTVRVFDVGQTQGGAFYLAMERLDGPSLESVLQERLDGGRTLTEVEAIDIAMPVLRALQEAHGHQLVHRDLKPANIVLADFGDGEPLVKILDFGIALTAQSSLTTSGMALGTPAYMSPEQCEAIGVDGRSDLYSLAIILFRCVSGDVPFNDRNPVAIMQAHLSSPLPPLRRLARTPLSDGFVACIERALEKERDDRYPNAAEMRRALEAVRTAHWQATPFEMPAVPREHLARNSTKRSRKHRPASEAVTLPPDLPDTVPTVHAPAAISPRPRRRSTVVEDAGPVDTAPQDRPGLVGAARRASRKTLLMGSGDAAGLSVLQQAPQPTQPTPTQAGVPAKPRTPGSDTDGKPSN